MQARLAETRFGRKGGREMMIPAGTVVRIIGVDDETGRMTADYRGYRLSIDQDQATPIDEEVLPVTTAERIAQMLGDDGMRWETQDGQTFAELVEAARATEQHDWAKGATRYLFPDGSAIVEQGGAWDIEGAMPFSWAGAE